MLAWPADGIMTDGDKGSPLVPGFLMTELIKSEASLKKSFSS